MPMEITGADPVAEIIVLQPQQRHYLIPIAIASVVVIGVLLHFVSNVFLSIITALFLANIFAPLVSRLRMRKVPMVISILLVLALVGGLFFGIAKIIGVTVESIILVMPKYEAKWENILLPHIAGILGNISDGMKQQAMDFNPSSLVPSNVMGSALTSATNLVSGFAIILLSMLFILAANGQFKKKIEIAFPKSGSLQLTKIIQNIERSVRRYLITTLILNTLAAVTMTIVLLLFGVDLAFLWGILTFLLMFIPTFGGLFAILLPVLASFLQFDSTITPILIAITVIVTQLMIGSVLTPRVMGSTLNISPLLIIVSIIFWGWVWGLLGMILAVPITSTIAIIFQNIPPLTPVAVLMSTDPGKVRLY
jgi:predicted PurR-regulated permease PerM